MLDKNKNGLLANFWMVTMNENLNTHKPEFEEWKWIDPLEALGFVVPFKKELYIKILEEFKFLY